MSTRCVITFIDNDCRHSVYKHCDGYPENILPAIDAAKSIAWELPRFEADDFASAFVAKHKKYAGDIRLSEGPDYHGDLAYAYEVREENGKLSIKTIKV